MMRKNSALWSYLMRKVCEFGRSMVEMLGVLAIIGVLSVGGIAGYSKAMLKYKINNSLDTLSQLIASIVEFRTSNSVRIGILDNNSDLKKIGIDCDLNNSNQCIFAFGTYSLDIRGVLGILTLNINAGANSKDFCTAFFNSKIYEYVPSEWWYNDSAFLQIEGFGGGEMVYAKSIPGVRTELTASDITDVCSYCDNEYNRCDIQWYMWNL